MAVIKCKMCGGDLEIIEGSTVCECEYCGTKQTVPSADNEKKLTLFARAGRLLRACEFDKASGVFETIVADFPEEAEAYWGLVLCKYGIEYVDDPATGKKIPTCHRSSFDSVLDDPNFEQACENTDAVARRVYRDEARQIEELRQAILQVSGREEPYDVFISYKETDGNGERTLDSVIAQDIYKELTGEGYRVFFSRISLEDKLGTEYEPYIFAALNSAKVMIVVGTDYENFDSVWVKNEWSRFLKLIARGEKKTLIPVFRNMDAYDMPKAFAKLAAQDMGKVGAMQDLVRGVGKIVGKKKTEPIQPQPVQQPVYVSGGPNVTAMLKRGQQALEDGEWDKARDFFNQVLNMDAENAEAFLGLALAETQSNNLEAFRGVFTAPNAKCRGSKNASRARQFGGEEMRAWFSKLDEESQRADVVYKNVISKKRAAANKCKTMIAAGAYHTVGLCIDGTVIAAGLKSDGQCKVSKWTDIVAIDGGWTHTVGLRSDGTVVATKYTGEQERYAGQCEVSGWTNIVAVAAGAVHTVGLRSDGTVVATKYTGDYKASAHACEEVSDWTDIVQITAGFTTLGLKSDGTVVTAGMTPDEESEVGSWVDIVAITREWFHTVGLRKDGTVISTESPFNHGQSALSHWKLFNSFDTLDIEQKAAKERAEAKRKKKVNALAGEKKQLKAELHTIKGLFAGPKKAKIEERLAQIEAELKKLG